MYLCLEVLRVVMKLVFDAIMLSCIRKSYRRFVSHHWLLVGILCSNNVHFKTNALHLIEGLDTQTCYGEPVLNTC